MKADTACRRLVEGFRNRRTVRAGSLITTVFGDSIAPRGGSVWLGSLIEAMRGFGISERLVRTSVFRLAKDGWLQSKQVGRRSYYSLTDEGRERFDVATHRIYASPTLDWDGRWALVVLSALETNDKETARRELGWLGFGALSANLLAHPAPDRADLKLTLQRLDMSGDIVMLEGQTTEGEKAMKRLTNSAWNLDDIAVRYERFLTMFRESFRAVERNPEMSGHAAFLLRTLLVQEYRKILLRDPQLPAALLPSDWPGRAAYQLCASLYARVHAAADRYVGDTMQTEAGPLPDNEPRFFERFGGLEKI